MTYQPVLGFLRSAPLPLDQALELAHAIAMALDRPPHGIEIENVWFKREADGKIVAQLQERPVKHDLALAIADRICLAPELITSSRIDERADVYAVGVILYRALTGHAPFEGDDPADSVKLRLTATAARPSARGARVPAEVDELVLEMIAPDPKQRPSVEEVRARLGALLPADARADVAEAAATAATAEEAAPAAEEKPPEQRDEPQPRRRLSPITAENRFFDEGDALDQAVDVVELPYDGAPPRRGLKIAGVIAGLVVVVVVAIVATRSPEKKETAKPSSVATTESPTADAAASQPRTREADIARDTAASHEVQNEPAEPMPPKDATEVATDVVEQQRAAEPKPAAEPEPAPKIASRESTTPAAREPAPTPAPRKPERRATPREVDETPPAPAPAPSEPDFLADAARLHAAGDHAGAYRMYFRASKSTDRKVAAGGYLGLAQLGLAQKRYSEAQRDARRALELGAESKRAWTVVARAACALGDANAAAAAHSQLGGGACE